MYPTRRVLLIFLLWFELVQNQSLNGCIVGACVDPYSQLYSYEQPVYDYSQYLQIAYANPYSQQYPIQSNYQQYYYPYQDDSQKPIVIILENEDRDDLLEIISLIVSMKDKSDNEPIYIPYPVSVTNNDYYYDFDCDCDCYSNCGCKNKGNRKSCKNDGPYCDSGFDDCGECRKRGRSKSKCRSNSDRGRSNKCDGIKHKSDCCCYY
ncbi:uncharacterized protein LOC125075190 [Vanessa atalanta]|uniref:uncharacterized protein LOC125075190 n=1 Tax=Vanessa atalanta TaxID=42275 RepID=UPI001FCD84F3|nr:uncharacterized protein LOC125075190 [Vanessa atalanta]